MLHRVDGNAPVNYGSIVSSEERNKVSPFLGSRPPLGILLFVLSTKNKTMTTRPSYVEVRK